MATNIPLISEEREDNYELELSRVREKIETKFAELIDCLKARESELLNILPELCPPTVWRKIISLFVHFAIP